MLIIPSRFLDVSYVASRIPCADRSSDLTKGANCQLFAYEILRYFGYSLPAFRSSDLWEDDIFTLEIQGQFQPLDLMLYHSTPEPYGAHVGLAVGEGKVIHLSQSLGKPEFRLHQDFALDKKYAYFVGAKRLKAI